MSPLKNAIGKDAYKIVEIGRLLLSEELNAKYKFTSDEDFEKLLRSNPSQGMKTYWLELFYRFHMGAYSGLKRLLSWIDIIEKSQENYISYCSAMRGLLECAGDTYHGLSQVAICLGDNKDAVNEALSGKATRFTTSAELEEMIIHFTHASKKYSQETNRPEHIPKKPWEYVSLLEKGSTIKFYDYYAFLCELTHPAAVSLGYNFEEENGVMTFNPNRDAVLVRTAFENDAKLMRELLMRGFNPIILLLKTINLFSLEDLHSKKADSITLDIPAWRRIQQG